MNKKRASKKAQPKVVGAAPQPTGVLWRALVLAFAVGAVMVGFIIFTGDRTDEAAVKAPPAKVTADGERPITR